jgi:glycosyltransferase involved in cell wall biosynthesis
MISFIIPAHNEEALIGRALTSIRNAADKLSEPSEVIVVNDASTDGTEQIAREFGATVVPVEFRQISRTRNAGAAKASGSILLFVDADTMVTPEVVSAAVNAIRNGAVGGGCTVRFDGRTPLYARLALPLLILSFRVMKFAAGCFLFCRRDAFEAVGGFDKELFASEEVALSRALKQHGRFVILRETVTTSGRKVRSHSMWEIIGILLRALMFWRRPLQQREGLDLWYGPRRDDPGQASENQPEREDSQTRNDPAR